jgi:hypothetical protein
LSLSFDVFQANCEALVEGMDAFKEAADHLRSIGIATIAASGNNGSTSGIGAPACVSGVISVGATFDGIDVIASYSNRSALLSLVAPGNTITSSIPGGGFATLNGTSMAAPHVAGAWAVLKQLAPAASVSSILSAMRETAAEVVDSAGTYLRMDLAGAALLLNGGLPGQPLSPQDPIVTMNSNLVTLAWTPPSSGSPATKYVVAAGSRPGASDHGTFDVGSDLSLSAIVGPGTYWVRVFAANPTGTSQPTPDVTFTVVRPTPPAPPTGLLATISNRTVTLTWQAPSGGSAPVQYIVEAGSAPGLANLAVFSTGSTGTTAVFTNVPTGIYHVRVRARSATLTGTPSSEIVVQVD